jgi:DNA modification methylase
LTDLPRRAGLGSWDTDIGTGNQWAIMQGGALEMLPYLPDGCVQTIVTSPPYFSLRDYGIEPSPWSEVRYAPMAGLPEVVVPAMDACLGLEPTIEAFVGHLVLVWRELRRVLRDDGCCWLNLGDSYANDGKWGGSTGGLHNPALHGDTGIGRRRTTTGLKPKDLMMIPARVALALQADGWFLRSDVIWAKKAPMPESVRDRPTRSHEHVFLLTKAARYFYDGEAVRVKSSGSYRGSAFNNGKSKAAREHLAPVGEKERVEAAGRNRRDVWTLGPAPFPGSHFATFPVKLPELCISAGTSAQGCCATCGAPWERVVEESREYEEFKAGRRGTKEYESRGLEAGNKFASTTPGIIRQSMTTGWRPTCDHDAAQVPCLVLDPFCGAGTTGLVARRLGRRFIGIEPSAEYVAMATERIRDDMPLLNMQAGKVAA